MKHSSPISNKKTYEPIFNFIVDHMRTKHCTLRQSKGTDSICDEPKQYQICPINNFVNESPDLLETLPWKILMTLMRIRLDCSMEDLAYRFLVYPLDLLQVSLEL